MTELNGIWSVVRPRRQTDPWNWFARGQRTKQLSLSSPRSCLPSVRDKSNGSVPDADETLVDRVCTLETLQQRWQLVSRLQEGPGITVRSRLVSVSRHGELSEPGRRDNRDAAWRLLSPWKLDQNSYGTTPDTDKVTQKMITASQSCCWIRWWTQLLSGSRHVVHLSSFWEGPEKLLLHYSSES